MNLNLDNLSWLPPYALLRHPRAKYVKFRYAPQSGLKITLPPRLSLKALPAIIEAHRDWILAQVNLHPKQVFDWPSEITLACLDQTFSMRYEKKQRVARLSELKSGVLIMAVDTPDEAIALLKRWLRRKAMTCLPPLFAEVSAAISLPFRALSIRAQQTVWGSCSADHSIRLNDKLLFFPWALARYIMVHELCHTVFLNHGKAFWALVEKHDPAYRLHKKQCRQHYLFMPAWIS